MLQTLEKMQKKFCIDCERYEFIIFYIIDYLIIQKMYPYQSL